MQGASETVRQIVEFEELVSRLDRLNDVVRPSSITTTTTTTTLSLSVPPPSPPLLVQTPHFGAASLPYDRLTDARRSSVIDRIREQQQHQQQQQQQQQRVRAHLGIDEDLRMILEMDPSIVDRTPAPVILPDNRFAMGGDVARPPLHATRPQGWYWIDRDFFKSIYNALL